MSCLNYDIWLVLYGHRLSNKKSFDEKIKLLQLKNVITYGITNKRGKY